MSLYDIIYCIKQVEQFGRELSYGSCGSVNIMIFRDIKIFFQSIGTETVVKECEVTLHHGTLLF